MQINQAGVHTGFTRECTKLAKGLAITLMLLHHTLPQSLDGSAALSFLFMDETVTLSVLFGRFGKLCVAIFTVLSGYGLFRSYGEKQLKKDELSFSLLTRVKGMYVTYWKAFMVFIAIKIIAGGGIAILGDIKTFFLNFFAIKSDYCGAWWFLGPYLILILLYPFFESFANRRNSVATTNLFWIFMLWTFGAYVYPQLMNHSLMCEYSVSMPIWWLLYWVTQLAASFLTGVVIAKMDLFSRWEMQFSSLGKQRLCSAIILIIVFIARSLHGPVPETKIPDFFYAAWFIVGFVGLVKGSLFEKMFCILGENSTYLWLLHPAAIYFILPVIPNKFGAIQNVVIVSIISFAIAFLLKKLEASLKKVTAKIVIK